MTVWSRSWVYPVKIGGWWDPHDTRGARSAPSTPGLPPPLNVSCSSRRGQGRDEECVRKPHPGVKGVDMCSCCEEDGGRVEGPGVPAVPARHLLPVVTLACDGNSTVLSGSGPDVWVGRGLVVGIPVTPRPHRFGSRSGPVRLASRRYDVPGRRDGESFLAPVLRPRFHVSY